AFEHDAELETALVLVQRYARGDLDLADPQLLLPRDELQRAAEARRIAGGEQLLGVRTVAAGAADSGRHDERQIDLAVVALDAAGASIGGSHGRGVDGFHGGEPTSYEPASHARYAPTSAIACAR